MSDLGETVRVRPLNEMDIGEVVRIDEKVTGKYRPDEWEERITGYIRRDPEASRVAEYEGRVIGFMLGEVRSGEFGLEETTGWIEAMGVDPDHRGKAVGRRLAEAMFVYFRDSGASRARTIVETTSEEIAGFFRAVGFEPAPLQAFQKDL